MTINVSFMMNLDGFILFEVYMYFQHISVSGCAIEITVIIAIYAHSKYVALNTEIYSIIRISKHKIIVNR